MRTRTLLLVLSLLALCALTVLAASVDGKWVASFTTPDGQTRETTMNFKAEGDKLTGTISGRAGETPIADGKISGDEISFSVVRRMGDNEVKMLYKGKVSGDTIQFTVSAGERSFEMTAKRAQ